MTGASHSYYACFDGTSISTDYQNGSCYAALNIDFNREIVTICYYPVQEQYLSLGDIVDIVTIEATK